MPRTFLVLVTVDVAALALPTNRLGSKLEFAVAAALTVVTAGYWLFRWLDQ